MSTRETQDFASLLARAFVIINGEQHVYIRWLTKVETQNLASHKQPCDIDCVGSMPKYLRTLIGRRKILRLYFRMWRYIKIGNDGYNWCFLCAAYTTSLPSRASHPHRDSV